MAKGNGNNGKNLFGETVNPESSYSFTTKSGYNLDEAISALQKFIRRGMEYEAVWMAHELVESGFWKYMFRRLMIIAAEDIGLADSFAHVLVSSVYSALVTEFELRKGKWFVPDQNRVDHVVLYMARTKKSRLVDHLGGIILKMRESGEKVEIPDYALDQHTKAGRAEGRGDEDWLKRGSKIENKKTLREDHVYQKRMLKLYGFPDMERDLDKF